MAAGRDHAVVGSVRLGCPVGSRRAEGRKSGVGKVMVYIIGPEGVLLCFIGQSWLILGCLILAGPHASQSQNPSSKKLWDLLKSQLSGSGGMEYFEKTVRGVALPALEGTLIASIPSDHPREFSVAISDDKTPEVILKLNGRLGKPLPVGTPVVFEGVVREFKAQPFTLTFEVETVNRATVPEKTEPPKKKDSK